MASIQAHLMPSYLLPRLGMDQLKQLETNFKDNRNPSDLDMVIIAAEVGISEQEVKLWFQNRLARWRQQQGLPANSGSVTD
ncbi:homeodomain-only protein [Patella vulgata]|uniref:homeodomain-only protein n=1 Tax=Patella vulgata TaxID=6465 RepID=UPI00217F3211|nr:homeodomain-only protein [Patella vulgata]